jgi:hypothetical protein
MAARPAAGGAPPPPRCGLRWGWTETRRRRGAARPHDEGRPAPRRRRSHPGLLAVVAATVVSQRVGVAAATCATQEGRCICVDETGGSYDLSVIADGPGPAAVRASVSVARAPVLTLTGTTWARPPALAANATERGGVVPPWGRGTAWTGRARTWTGSTSSAPATTSRRCAHPRGAIESPWVQLPRHGDSIAWVK